MRLRSRFVIGTAIIAVAIGYLVVTAIRNTSEYYLTVPEVAARVADLRGQPLRIAGRVKPGTISWEPSSLTLKFAIVAIPEAAPGALKTVSAADSSRSFDVTCVGQPKPDMFAPDRDVIVEGRLNSAGAIEATQVLTSCPSKYRPQQGK